MITKQDVLNVREQIQDNLTIILDGFDDDLITDCCQAVCDEMEKLMKEFDDRKKVKTKGVMPLCHKCANRITEDKDDGILPYKVFVGCTANAEIKTYNHAQVMCPLFN